MFARLSITALVFLATCADTQLPPDSVVADTVTAGETVVDVAVETPSTPLEECSEADAGKKRCATAGVVETCSQGAWRGTPCAAGSVCDAGECLPTVCTPGESYCLDSRTRMLCNAAGTRLQRDACRFGVCANDICATTCQPGFRRCEGADVLECGSDSVELVVETCDASKGEQCGGGVCLSECAIKGAKRGYLACDFWAADLPNDLTAIDNIFAFAFTNGSEQPAVVTVTYPWGPVERIPVSVGGTATHRLPLPRTLSQIREPGIGRYGFRIESDQPIAAFMFNPLERYDLSAESTVATNDASLLIPATALGTRYLAVTWSDPGQYSSPPYVTVVAMRDGTVVTVRPTSAISMGQSPYLFRAGEETRVTLQAFETLNLETPSSPGIRRDLTGTSVVSLNYPIAVFSGNRCARVPDSGRFCDHIETQLPPLDTWGNSFVVTKFADRGGEADYFRVVAQEGITELEFDPPRNAPSLVAGGMWEFNSKVDFTLKSSRPVLLAQFMASQNMTKPPGPFGVSGDCPHEVGGTCQGDPALVLAAPIDQWRKDLIFLVPDTYEHQFINVAFAAGTTLTLDGVALDLAGATAIGDSAWRRLIVPMRGGFHTLVGSEPVGVVVYGYDHNISYAYSGGLDHKVLGQAPF